MRRMINEYTQMGVHQDLYPPSEPAQCPLTLKHKISFHLKLFYMFTLKLVLHLLAYIQLLGHFKVHTAITSLFLRGEQSNNHQMGYNS